MPQKPKILFLFPHAAAQLVQDTRSGKQPSERLYGINELAARGWEITVSDARFTGWVGRLITCLKGYGLNLIDFTTISQIRSHNIVLVKDDFSIPISLACKIFGKKLVYYDSMFQLPTTFFDRCCTSFALRNCDAVLAYSDYQIDLWCDAFGLPRKKFRKIPYSIDSTYYLKGFPALSDGGYVLSIGRDVGRDFKTLVVACKKLGVKLKLITLDYLTQGIGLPDPSVEVIQNVSYMKLFELYASASVVALPLKNGITYPSGIRAALECLLLRKPLVVTETPVLKEMLPPSRYKFFARPEDANDLTEQLRNALKLNREDYAMQPVVIISSVEELGSSLDHLLNELAPS